MTKKLLTAVALGLSASAARASAGVHPAPAPGPQVSSPLHRIGPAGGWNPDGRGIFHWWDPDCFVPSCAPDDYDRKPLPRQLCPPRPATPPAVHRHGWLRRG